MSGNIYEACALVLRFLFAGLGVFILARGAVMTVKDASRARFLRSKEAETGVLAHFDILQGEKKTDRVFLYREGCVGSGRGADTRVHGAGLKKKHFFYEIANGTLIVTPLDGASVSIDGEECPDGVEVRPGGRFTAGGAEFKFVVNRIPVPPLSPGAKRVYGGIMDKVMAQKK